MAIAAAAATVIVFASLFMVVVFGLGQWQLSL
jgi:hypothetical protein